MGDFDFSRTDFTSNLQTTNGDVENGESDLSGAQGETGKGDTSDDSSPGNITFIKDYIETYTPKVVNREWILSETDLAWITTGCYILGTGGGGSPYQHMLRLREMMRDGAVVRIISPWDLKDDDLVACGGGKGSPQVSIEKAYGEE